MRSRAENGLFSKHNLGDVIRYQEDSLAKEIEGLDREYLLNVSLDDLVGHLEDKFRMNPLLFHKDKIYIKSEGEADIDVRYDPNRWIHDKSKPFYLKGTTVTFALPYEGDRDLLFCQPSTFTLNPPRANVTENEILVTYGEVDFKPDEIKKRFEKLIEDISKYADYVNRDIKPFNDRLKANANAKIEARRAKLLKDKGVVAALGFPIKAAPGVPQTYSVPSIKKKVVIQKPIATTTPFQPEPSLDMVNYEEILKIISNMVLVMERSPRAFVGMKEEDLRQHFLVQLNGHFEGQATGETFNYEGKTDILIRVNGKNIFIGECMYWAGEKSLLDKIDQLLGYASWRDTKVAVLVFNRNQEFSKVVAQIPVTVKNQKNYKRQQEYKSESGYRFTLQHTDDPNRELTLTVLAFDIPKK